MGLVREIDTYPILETWLVLEAIDREAPGLVLVAVRVRVRHDRRGLLCHTTGERILLRYRRVGDDLVVARVLPDVRVVERLRSPSHTVMGLLQCLRLQARTPCACEVKIPSTYRPLCTLGDLCDEGVLVDLRLEHVDFGRGPANEGAIGVFRPRMALAGACAPGQPLAGKEGQNAAVSLVAVDRRRHRLSVHSLVRDSADVAGVVRVRPLRMRTSAPRQNSSEAEAEAQRDGRQVAKANGRIVSTTSNAERVARLRRRTMPSRDAPYPARPRFPIVQTAGQSPRMLFTPGSETFVSMYPPVKQNLFHVDIIPRRRQEPLEAVARAAGAVSGTLTALIVQIVRLLLRQRDDQVPALGGDSLGVVPL